MSLVTELRTMTGAGENEYSINGVAHWTDPQLQVVLDMHAVAHHRIGMVLMQEHDGAVLKARLEASGTFEPGDEQGVIRDRNGLEIGDWSIDGAGVITFATDVADLRPSEYSGSTYDLNAAAADVLYSWAAAVALHFDVDADGQSMSRSQKHKHLVDLAQSYRRRALPQSVTIGAGW